LYAPVTVARLTPSDAASVRSAGRRLSIATRPSRISDRIAAASRWRLVPSRFHGPSNSVSRLAGVIGTSHF
jgi:hypothetical protein